MQKYQQYHWNIACLHIGAIEEELLGEEETTFIGCCCQSRVGSVLQIVGGEGKINEIVKLEIEFLIRDSSEENQVVECNGEGYWQGNGHLQMLSVVTETRHPF